MLLVKFDYGLNMKVCIGAGALQVRRRDKVLQVSSLQVGVAPEAVLAESHTGHRNVQCTNSEY